MCKIFYNIKYTEKVHLSTKLILILFLNIYEKRNKYAKHYQMKNIKITV